MQLAVFGHALDGGQALSFGLDCEHRAALDRLAIDEDGAGAALAGVTADVRSGQADDIAQVVHEQETRLDLVLMLAPVDGGRDLVLHTSPPNRRWRRSWRRKTCREQGRQRPADGGNLDSADGGDLIPS